MFQIQHWLLNYPYNTYQLRVIIIYEKLFPPPPLTNYIDIYIRIYTSTFYIFKKQLIEKTNDLFFQTRAHEHIHSSTYIYICVYLSLMCLKYMIEL